MKRVIVIRLIILLGLIPTVGVFVWGVHTSLQTKAVQFSAPFTPMK